MSIIQVGVISDEVGWMVGSQGPKPALGRGINRETRRSQVQKKKLKGKVAIAM